MKIPAIVLSITLLNTVYAQRFINKDGLEYIFIKPGKFLMGCVPGDSLCDSIEKPQRKVLIKKGFYISATEVTVAAFRKFIQSTGYIPESISQNKGRVYSNDSNWQWAPGTNWEYPFDKNKKAPDNYPVTQVSYNDALAYCQWLGGRLPTEEEWEYAARGNLVNKKYPWGNEWPPVKNRKPLANTADKNTLGVFPSMEGLQEYDDGFAMSAPVGSFAANGFGLYDMAGNVWEWTNTPFRNDYIIVRGGAWCYYPQQMRCSYRGYFEKDLFWTGSLGFRCVMDLANVVQVPVHRN